MNHEMSSRLLTSQEASRLKRSAQTGMKGQMDDLVFFTLIFGGLIVIGIALAAAAGWLATGLGLGGYARLLAITILVVSTLFGVRAAIPAVCHSRHGRQLAMRDIEARTVEVIRVENARLVQQEEHRDEGPLYYFGIGPGKVLFLGGQWLHDSDVYGVDTEEPSFPSSSFIVHRLTSGPVLRIDITGVQLAPEAVLHRKVRPPAWLEEPFKKGFLGDSLILEGDFDEVLRRASANVAGSGHGG